MVSLDGASFPRRRKGWMVIIRRGMIFAKIFYGGMASLLNSSTASSRSLVGAEAGHRYQCEGLVFYSSNGQIGLSDAND